jgi:hypothetical protein
MAGNIEQMLKANEKLSGQRTSCAIKREALISLFGSAVLDNDGILVAKYREELANLDEQMLDIVQAQMTNVRLMTSFD